MLRDSIKTNTRKLFIKALQKIPYMKLRLTCRSLSNNEIVMYVVPDGFDSLEENILSNNVYFSPQELVRAKTIIDLGAHHGSFTIYALHSATPGTRIIAVEPNPLSYMILLNNLHIYKDIIKSKKLTIIPIQAAAWHNRTKLPLALTDWSETAHIAEYDSLQESIYVETVTMDDLINISKPPIIVKMDIEGAERTVFLKNKWLDYIDSISLEVHGDWYREISRILLYKNFKVKLVHYRACYTLSKTWLNVKPLWYGLTLSFYRFMASTLAKPIVRIIKAYRGDKE